MESFRDVSLGASWAEASGWFDRGTRIHVFRIRKRGLICLSSGNPAGFGQRMEAC